MRYILKSPRFLLASSSPNHRLPAISLFRTLLAQSRATPLEAEERNDLQNVIRNRFKYRRYSIGQEQLKTAYNAGYEALDLLDAAVAGDLSSLSQIRELLLKTSPKLKRAPKQKSPSPKAALRKKTSVAAFREAEDSILMRPRPVVPGIRRVPVLFHAHSIPVLRIKKPQPLMLSRYLDRRIKQKQSRVTKVIELQALREVCKAEDTWDRQIVSAFGPEALENGQFQGPAWLNEVQASIVEIRKLLQGEKTKNAEMAAKMIEIVDKERELAKSERQERRCKRNEKKESSTQLLEP